MRKKALDPLEKKTGACYTPTILGHRPLCALSASARYAEFPREERLNSLRSHLVGCVCGGGSVALRLIALACAAKRRVPPGIEAIAALRQRPETSARECSDRMLECPTGYTCDGATKRGKIPP